MADVTGDWGSTRAEQEAAVDALERENVLRVIDTLEQVVGKAVFEKHRKAIKALRKKVASGLHVHGPEIQAESARLQALLMADVQAQG